MPDPKDDRFGWQDGDVEFEDAKPADEPNPCECKPGEACDCKDKPAPPAED